MRPSNTAAHWWWHPSLLLPGVTPTYAYIRDQPSLLTPPRRFSAVAPLSLLSARSDASPAGCPDPVPLHFRRQPRVRPVPRHLG